MLRLNQMTIAKYSDMTSLAGRLNLVSKKLNEKCESLKTYIVGEAQILDNPTQNSL